jgi:hypothetical protein
MIPLSPLAHFYLFLPRFFFKFAALGLSFFLSPAFFFQFSFYVILAQRLSTIDSIPYHSYHSSARPRPLTSFFLLLRFLLFSRRSFAIPLVITIRLFLSCIRF